MLDARRQLKQNRAAAEAILVPLVKDRIQSEKTPTDMLQWMIEGAEGADRDPRVLTQKALILCLASVTSGAITLTNAIFDMCAYPEHIAILREEIESAISEEDGWNLAALRKMEKLDSFLKESQRLSHPGLCKYQRMVQMLIHRLRL